MKVPASSSMSKKREKVGGTKKGEQRHASIVLCGFRSSFRQQQCLPILSILQQGLTVVFFK